MAHDIQTPPLPEQVLYQIVDSLSSGVMALDQHGTILYANAAASTHLMLPEGALAPGTPIPAGGACAKLLEAAIELQRLKEPIRRREIEWVDGNRKRILGLTASLSTNPSAFEGTVLLFVDLTEIRRIERSAALNAQLAQIGELTAGVVHELRNPLSVISGMAEYLLRKLDDNEVLKKKAGLIHDEAFQLNRLITQFLCFAKPMDIDRIPCDVGHAVEHATQLCAKLEADCKGRLDVQVDAGLPPVQGDSAKLAQAFGNLIRNALEAMPDGGTVYVRACLEGEQVLVRFEDEGPGIEVQPGENVFSPFFSKKPDGTGLGLSIVHRTVQAHGGNIRYQNAPSGGCVFEVRLPQAHLVGSA